MPLLGMVNLLRGRVLKEAWLASAPSLFDDFDNKDICQYFNELNIKLQGPHKTVIVMMDLIRALEAKLYVFQKRYYYKKLQVLPKLEKNITDLDAQEKRNEEKSY
ncbi:hypothetical protein TNCV_2006331 [Trichonephila clavipes]|nr:hypothetical protein TNCV_2006331 [Trichonephila clavipes]